MVGGRTAEAGLGAVYLGVDVPFRKVGVPLVGLEPPFTPAAASWVMAYIIIQLLRVAAILFIVRAIFSWVRISGDSPLAGIASVVYQLTEPVLSRVRRVIPPMGAFDLSILVVIIAINYLLIPLVAQTLG
ncbi:MAG: YggT family protein [Acidimicrobiia bacterium]|nr:YggT family protein [Acidimicrobiia bacterium]